MEQHVSICTWGACPGILHALRCCRQCHDKSRGCTHHVVRHCPCILASCTQVFGDKLQGCWQLVGFAHCEDSGVCLSPPTDNFLGQHPSAADALNKVLKLGLELRVLKFVLRRGRCHVEVFQPPPADEQPQHVKYHYAYAACGRLLR